MDNGVRVVGAELRQPVDQFDRACERTVGYLRRIVPMSMWAVTRVEGDVSTLLVVEDDAYGVTAGASLPFPILPCSYMVTGAAPVIAADARLVREYAECGFAQKAPLGAYVGIPVTTSESELFGTICGYDPAPKPSTLDDCRPLLDMVATLLSAVLSADRAATGHRRQAEALGLEADTDALTGLRNRRGWMRHVMSEDPRYRRFGDPATIVMVDLDGLKKINDTEGHERGDRYIALAADAMRSVMRPTDVIARLGGDEFGLMVPGVSAVEAPVLIDRLADSFAGHGVGASIGWAPVDVSGGIGAACVLADERMYAAKRSRRAVPSGVLA